MREPDVPRSPRTRTQNVLITDKDSAVQFPALIEQPVRGNPKWGKQKGRRDNFSMNSPIALSEVQVSGGDWRVFWKIAERAEFNTGIANYTLAEVAIATGPNADVQTSAAIRRLIEAGLIRRVGRGRVQLNPQFVWKGDSNAADRAYEE